VNDARERTLVVIEMRLLLFRETILLVVVIQHRWRRRNALEMLCEAPLLRGLILAAFRRRE
jgi:hypothetical protein